MRKRVTSLVVAAFLMAGVGAGYQMTHPANEENPTTSIVVMQAEYPEYDTARDLVGASNLVFHGVVRNIDYRMLDVSTSEGAEEDTGFSDAEAIPYTLYTVEVDKIYKGTIENDTITIKRPGGRLGEEEYIVEDATEISAGRDYLFVTEAYEDTYPSLLNVTQSAYDMDAPQTMSEGGKSEITLSEILALF